MSNKYLFQQLSIVDDDVSYWSHKSSYAESTCVPFWFLGQNAELGVTDTVGGSRDGLGRALRGLGDTG